MAKNPSTKTFKNTLPSKLPPPPIPIGTYIPPDTNPGSTTVTNDQELTKLPPEMPNHPSGATTGTQSTVIASNKAQLRTIPEQESHTIGIHFQVSNSTLDITNLVTAFLENIQPLAILDYRADETKAQPKSALLTLLHEDPQAACAYIGMRDDRSRNGNNVRRSAALYVQTTQTYQEMKTSFLNRIGDRANMMTLGWYINRFYDIDPVQRIFAVLLGKNPKHGYAEDYATRLSRAISSDKETFRFSVVVHNETLADGTKIPVFGLQIGRSQVTAAERHLRHLSQPVDGLYLLFKSDKADRQTYDQEITNIHHLSSIYTGIPIQSLASSSVAHLRQVLTNQKQSLPVDLEATRLSESIGKYMAIIPTAEVDYFRKFLTQELTAAKYTSDQFKHSASLSDSRIPTNAPPKHPSASASVFGDLSIHPSIKDQSSTRTYATRFTLPPPPPIAPPAANVWEHIPHIILTSAKTYSQAAAEDNSQSGGDTVLSAISKLTEENSLLQKSLQEKDAELRSLQADNHKEINGLRTKIGTLEQTLTNMQGDQEQSATLIQQLQKQNETMIKDHKRDITEMQTSHKQDIKELQKSHEATMHKWFVEWTSHSNQQPTDLPDPEISTPIRSPSTKRHREGTPSKSVSSQSLREHAAAQYHPEEEPNEMTDAEAAREQEAFLYYRDHPHSEDERYEQEEMTDVDHGGSEEQELDDQSTSVPEPPAMNYAAAASASLTQLWRYRNLKDNLPHGDILQLPKPDDTTRLYFQNTNGFQLLDNSGGTYKVAHHTLRPLAVDIGGFSETKLDSTQPRICRQLNSAIKSINTRYKQQASSGPLTTTSYFKPGGTITYALGNVTSRFLSKHADPIGRWSSISLQRKSHRPLTIITAYQPCKGPPRPDSSTVITQHFAEYTRQKRPQPRNVRRHFITDLISYIQTLQQENHSIILAGDFNDTFGEHNSGITKLVRKTSLVDPIHQLHGTPPSFTTWLDGSKTLDYIFISPDLLPSIRKCGYERFLARLPGDHRAMYIDFDSVQLFGNPDARLAPPTKRLLKSSNPQHVSLYFKAKHQYLLQQNFFQRLQHLKAHPNNTTAEKLDRILTQASLYAEKQLPQYPDLPFSPALTQIRSRFHLYRLLLRQYTHSIDLDLEIRQAIADQYQDFTFPETLEECQRLHKSTYQELKQLELQEKKNGTNRDQFLQERATQYAEHGDLTAAQYLKRLKQCEATQRVFRKLAKARGKGPSSGFTTIEVPSDPNSDPKQCQHWKTLDCPKEIEQHLLQRNQQHFGQAQGTPLTIPPLQQEIDFGASTATTDLILNGGYTHEDLSATTQQLIDHLQRVSPPVVDSLLTLSEFQSKLRIWRETTSTSPSGVHLGHLRSYFAPCHWPQDSPEAIQFFQDRQEILDAHLYLINYAITHGYSYTRWQKIVTMMIEKEPGNHKIHRLRVIHIYEADYNLLLGVKWRQTAMSASTKQLLNDSQNGGAPGKTANDVVYAEELEYEICRATRTHLGKFDNDATSCYDRIHCFLANIASQKYGLDRKICIVQGRTLQEAKYYLRTQLGISEGCIQHSYLAPIYGTGQGSGNSPAYWLFISSVLFDCHSEKAHGATFASPDHSTEVKLCMLGFVDDTSNRTNSFFQNPQPTIQQLEQLIQTDAQLWNDLLWSSGGALELPKCTYHHIRFTFDIKGRPHMLQGQFSNHLQVINTQGHPTSIKQLSISTPHKLLGCHKSPFGDQRKQLSVLRANCDSFALLPQHTALTWTESTMLYHHIYVPSVTYPLATTFFTSSQLDKTQSKAVRSITRSCGYSGATPKLLLHGPTQYGCPQFPALQESQGLQQLQLFIKHWRTPSLYQSLLQIAVSWWQMIAGVHYPIFQFPNRPLPHFDSESKYFRSIRTFLNHIQGSLELDNPFVPPLQRQNDAFIMDLVLDSQRFTTTEIRYVNLVRLHLQVITVADLAKADGKNIDMSLRDGHPSLQSSISRNNICHQAAPSCPMVWQAWRKACYLFSTQTGILKQPLKKWLRAASHLRRQWFSYYDKHTQNLYIRHQGQYSVHPVQENHYDLQPSHLTRVIPIAAFPVEIQDYQFSWKISRDYHSIHIHLRNQADLSFHASLDTTPAWEKQLYYGLTFCLPLETIVTLLTTNSLILATDGSAPSAASFGWILSTTTGCRLLQNFGPAPGHDPTSFRAEGYGMLSALSLLLRLQEYFNITLPSLPLYCDNLSLVDKLTELRTYSFFYANTTLASEWDVLATILTQLGKFQNTIHLHHIKGHQDEKKPYATLSLPAQLNCDADKLADKYLELEPFPQATVPLLPSAHIQLHLAAGTITHHLKRYTILASRGPAVLKYLCSKNNWDDPTSTNIDWDLHGLAYRNTAHKTTMFKLFFHCLPVGFLTHKYNPKYNPTCPTCHNEVETFDHFHRCDHTSRTAARASLLQAVRTTMMTNQISETATMIAIHGLESYFFNTPPPDPLQFPLYSNLIQHQNSIGWLNFLRGRWSQHWSYLPGRDKWQLKTIQKMWEKWFQMWEQRNKDLHGYDQATRNEAKRVQAHREVSLMYDLFDNSPLHHTIFSIPLPVFLQRPTYVLRNWLSLWTPVLLPSDDQRLPAEDAPT